jgi:hypothetical protein
MLDRLLTDGLQYAGYLLQVLLLVVLAVRGHWRRLVGVSLYLVVFASIDSVARPYTLIHYGLKSWEYYYVYWLTDVVLTVLAFALVCAFFRRACASDEKMWHNLRPLLAFVFLLLAAISYFMIASKFQHFYSDFIFQFSQNTYFACLVLTTLLYIMMQRSEVRDEELAMLVCGMGILFAAPTAALAGHELLPKSYYVEILTSNVEQLCMLGMLFTWWYAITKLSHGAAVRADVSALART